MKQTRKKHSPAFKAKVALAALKGLPSGLVKPSAGAFKTLLI